MGRYIIELNGKQERRLAQVQRSLGAASKAETIRRSLAFLSAVERRCDNPVVAELLQRLLTEPDEPVVPDLAAVHRLCRFHRAAVEHSKQCGCFYCSRVFAASEIRDWVHHVTRGKKKLAGVTALCPHCGIDAVLPDALIEVTSALLTEMHKRYFTVREDNS